MMSLASLLPLSIFFSGVQQSLGHYPVDYQIHSNNDLDEWEQLLIKGATRFKVDLHYHEEGGNCAQKGFDSECFLLSHDKPNKEYISYNSSEELVNFLNECQSLRQSEEEIVISFCFKSAPDKCDDSSESFSTWLAMVDSLYATLTTHPPEGVQFVLDGDAKPENCLAGRWEEWDSVWIQGSSPDEALYSNEGNNGRFQVLNDREGKLDWYKMAQEDYGKFTNSTSPYHLWEPDSQADFHEYIKIYESGKEHTPGFCFAINIDIAMFGIYTTPTTDLTVGVDSASQQSSSVNVKLVEEEGASHPHIVSLFEDSVVLEETFLFLYQEKSLALQYSTLSVELASTPPLKSSVSHPLLNISHPRHTTKEKGIGDEKATLLPNSTWLIDSDSAEIVGISVSHSSSATTTVLITAASGKYCVYASSPVGVVLDLMVCDSFAETGSVVYDAIFTPCEKEVTASSSLCALVLSGEEDNSDLLVSSLVISEGNTGHINSQHVKLKLISGEYIRNANNESLLSNGVSSARFAQGVDNLMIFASVQNQILATLWASDETVLPTSTWTTIGVGNHIDISVSSGGVVMLVTDYGFCYNSHKHNTRSTEKVCSSIPTPSKHVLDYNIGYEKDWVALLTSDERFIAMSSLSNTDDSQESESNRYITPCHKRILHGSFDQGLRPSVSLSSLTSVPFFLELHEGLSRLTVPNGGCGNPLHRGGLILDSFPIDHWVKNLEISE